jgi:acetamidase/formamidase
MRHHHLPASVDTCVWGYFEAAKAPVLTVADGDRVTIDALSGAADVLPPKGFHVPPELFEIHAAHTDVPFGPHILTGPVAIEGAEPGDVLEIRILDVKLRQDWGYTRFRPLSGTLPDDFPVPHIYHSALDAERGVGRMPWGQELKLAPFFGVMGVSPPPGWGRMTSIMPRTFGGNMDLKELVAGTTLFLPVYVKGANFSCGDGHGVQGDGEVCVTAIETALQGTFEFVVRKDMKLNRPRVETPTHHITTGSDADLDRCAEIALREMIAFIVEQSSLSREEAYALCSLAADLRITQTVNQQKGVHCMIAKENIPAKR